MKIKSAVTGLVFAVIQFALLAAPAMAAYFHGWNDWTFESYDGNTCPSYYATTQGTCLTMGSCHATVSRTYICTVAVANDCDMFISPESEHQNSPCFWDVYNCECEGSWS